MQTEQTISRDNPIKLYLDGDEWCALLGEDLQSGEAEFSSEPVDAVAKLVGRLGIKTPLEKWISKPL